MRAMIKAWRHVPFGRRIGAELAGNDLFGQPVTFDQAEGQPFRGPLVALGLQDFLQNNVMLIDRAPEPELTPRDFHNDLVQMPDITGPRMSAPQVPCDLQPEFGGPPPDGFIRHVNATLEQHPLNLTQAQIEPNVQLNRMGNDLWQKAVALVADFLCLHRYRLCSDQ